MKKLVLIVVLLAASLSLTACGQTADEKYDSCMKSMTDPALGSDAASQSDAEEVCAIVAS